MDRIVVLGAGELGGLTAHVLARRQISSEICLIDDNGRAAGGKALDIMQAAPVEGFASKVVGTSDASLVAGAAAVVIADAVGGGEWHGELALGLLKRVSAVSPGSPIVCAGASQRESIEQAARELHIERSRLIGSAPEALGAGVRAVVGAEARVSPRDVAATTVGVPPDHVVVLWEHATIAGFPLDRIVTAVERRRIEMSAARLWPPGPYALASAVAKVLDTLLGRSDRLVTCFVAPDDRAGRRTRAAALPVRLGRTGIVDIVLPELTGRDRVRLDNAMML